MKETYLEDRIKNTKSELEADIISLFNNAAAYDVEDDTNAYYEKGTLVRVMYVGISPTPLYAEIKCRLEIDKLPTSYVSLIESYAKSIYIREYQTMLVNHKLDNNIHTVDENRYLDDDELIDVFNENINFLLELANKEDHIYSDTDSVKTNGGK